MTKEKMDAGDPKKPEQQEILTLIEKIKQFDEKISTMENERNSLVSRLYNKMPEDEFKRIFKTVKYIDEADPTSYFSKKIFRAQEREDTKE